MRCSKRPTPPTPYRPIDPEGAFVIREVTGAYHRGHSLRLWRRRPYADIVSELVSHPAWRAVMANAIKVFRPALFVALFCLAMAASGVAQEACASAEACLAKAFDRDRNRYYELIDKTWSERKRVAVLLRQAELQNEPQLMAQLREAQGIIE